MGRLLNFIWLAAVAVVLVLLGQTTGLYDVPPLRDLTTRLLLPQPANVVTQVGGTATPFTVAARQLPSPSPVAQTSETCSVAAPRFVHGTATLKAALGERMGEATECERVVDAAGNTEQKTTVGLAYYRARSNTAAFTNGFDHWALGPSGVVHWTGDDLEPPTGAEPLR